MMDPNIPPASSRSTLACERCKRRKIKCDRSLPKCRTCCKTSRECSYPLISNKPGPKPGVSQRRRARTHASPSEVGTSAYQPTARHVPDTIPVEPAEPASLASVEQRTETAPSRLLALSQLLHPSHELFPQNSTGVTRLGSQSQSYGVVVENICSAFKISCETYKSLVDAYFENMTSFSLFHKPSFDTKLSNISSPVLLQALVASMFSFSARFVSGHSRTPSPRQFYDLASRLTDTAMQDCADQLFPLCLLQSLIHITFQQLTSGVRGRAWRSIGTCVRVAYELQLHLVDKVPSNSHSSPSHSVNEEKRRAWWAIWEFDVFAGTIRRLPTAIDWRENETWLPVDDKVWFANSCARSCKLDPDPAMAWKALQRSGNPSSKAWFIILNALMRCAHVLSYPQAYCAASFVEHGESPPGLDVLANSLYCLTAALPSELVYKGEILRFTSGSLQADSAKHGVYIMTQLSRFMINHYQVFDSTSRQLGEQDKSSSSTSSALTPLDQAAWNHYLNAASEIVSLIRNCPQNHIQHANPFLAGTIWLAAAAQVVSKSFGLELVDARIADTNLDVLQTNLNAFVEFWGVSDMLQIKLGTLESKLKAFAENGRSDLVSNPQQFPPAREDDASLQSSQAQQPDLHPAKSWMGGNKGYVQRIWTEPSFDLTNPAFVADMNQNLWGWGMDELMNYSGIE